MTCSCCSTRWDEPAEEPVQRGAVADRVGPGRAQGPRRTATQFTNI